jgi:hypothetical protein
MSSNLTEKVMVTGTGRCGTTLIIKIFSFVGMNTGYTLEDYTDGIDTGCNAGMERPVMSRFTVLKNPLFLSLVPNILEEIRIKYMIVPIRDYVASAESRKRHTDMGLKGGGFVNGAKDVESQVALYNKAMAKFVLDITKYDVPTIFLDFDRMISDRKYVWNKLKPVFDDFKVSEEVFNKAYTIANETSKPSR